MRNLSKTIVTTTTSWDITPSIMVYIMLYIVISCYICISTPKVRDVFRPRILVIAHLIAEREYTFSLRVGSLTLA